MKPLAISAILIAVSSSAALADWCDPPTAPPITTLELAHEFREEFKDEFDQYFRNASVYAACLDAERVRIFEEMKNTAQRYERFLEDSQLWEQ